MGIAVDLGEPGYIFSGTNVMTTEINSPFSDEFGTDADRERLDARTRRNYATKIGPHSFRRSAACSS